MGGHTIQGLPRTRHQAPPGDKRGPGLCPWQVSPARSRAGASLRRASWECGCWAGGHPPMWLSLGPQGPLSWLGLSPSQGILQEAPQPLTHRPCCLPQGMPRAFGAQHPPPACHRQPGGSEAPRLAGPNTLWTCLRITWEEKGAHKHPAFSSSSLVFFAFF